MAARLTDREQQIALKMLQGYPALEIAQRMNLSRRTVKNYRLSIYRKLDITTERELFGEYIAALRGAQLALD
jgi:DNA-binding CsgD family transcriptional regulator